MKRHEFDLAAKIIHGAAVRGGEPNHWIRAADGFSTLAMVCRIMGQFDLADDAMMLKWVCTEHAIPGLKALYKDIAA